MNITHKEIINLWPSLREFANDINESYNKVQQWDVRDSIPAKFWVDLVAIAQERDIAITYKQLAEAAANKK